MNRVILTKKARKDIKNLKKNFRRIDEDLDHLFATLSGGKLVGSRIQNFQDLEIYKARIRNSSAAIGKSGGFRVIYYLKRNDGEIIALTIYSKGLKSNISKKEIENILKEENL